MFIFNHYITFTETSTSRRESRRYNNNWISQNLLKSTEICVAITKPVRVWDGLPSWHQCLKNPPAIAGDLGSIPGSGRSHGGGHGNPPQYSCLKNPMDRGAWRATVRGVTKSQTWLKGLSTAQCVSANPKPLIYPPPFPFGNHNLFPISGGSISISYVRIFVSFF